MYSVYIIALILTKENTKNVNLKRNNIITIKEFKPFKKIKFLLLYVTHNLRVLNLLEINSNFKQLKEKKNVFPKAQKY